MHLLHLNLDLLCLSYIPTLLLNYLLILVLLFVQMSHLSILICIHFFIVFDHLVAGFQASVPKSFLFEYRGFLLVHLFLLFALVNLFGRLLLVFQMIVTFILLFLIFFLLYFLITRILKIVLRLERFEEDCLYLFYYFINYLWNFVRFI